MSVSSIQMRESNRSFFRRLPLVALILSGAVLFAAMLPPFLGERAASFLTGGFALVCHQLPDRSPTIDGVQMAVCHRCFGIYFGLFLAALVFPFLVRYSRMLMRHAGIVIVLSLAPASIDWMGDVLGLWANTPLSRVATGLVFGAAAGFYFARAVEEIVRQYRGRSAPSESVSADARHV